MMEPIYVHRETYLACHTQIVAHLILYRQYGLQMAREEADQILKYLRYVHDDRLTEHEAA